MSRHSHIYVPRTLEGGEILIPRVRYRGFVTVERFRGNHLTGLKTGHWEFENLIVNGGLNYIEPYDGIHLMTALAYMACGTGSTTPAATDTALVAEISPSSTQRTNDNGGISDVHGSGPSYTYISLTRTRLFSESQANGNLTELAWFTAVSGGTMWSRMLFKDGGGSPTTVVKTSSDQLRVTYEVRAYPPTADVTGTISISSASYDYTIRASEIGSGYSWHFSLAAGLGSALSTTQAAEALETQTLGATTGRPAGSGVGASSATWATYVDGDYYRDVTLKWEPPVANFPNGVGSLTLGSSSGGGHRPMFQVSFDPEFPKINTMRLTLVMRYAWARH